MKITFFFFPPNGHGSKARAVRSVTSLFRPIASSPGAFSSCRICIYRTENVSAHRHRRTLGNRRPLTNWILFLNNAVRFFDDIISEYFIRTRSTNTNVMRQTKDIVILREYLVSRKKKKEKGRGRRIFFFFMYLNFKHFLSPPFFHSQIRLWIQQHYITPLSYFITVT